MTRSLLQPASFCQGAPLLRWMVWTLHFCGCGAPFLERLALYESGTWNIW